MIQDFCIIVSSCEKFSDLWDAHFGLLRKYWKGDLPEIYLVTDKPSNKQYDGVKILVYDGNMPIRLYQACRVIESQYVLITLDDYFLIRETNEQTFSYMIDTIKNRQFDYLSIYNRRYAKKRYYTGITFFKEIDLSQKYALSLYPAIWNRDFFEKCVDKDISPWEFEPQLTKNALKYKAKCFSNNAGIFEILDVVRKGKVLHKAKKYLTKHKIDIGKRETIEWKYEIKQGVADFIWWHMPKWVYYMARTIAEKMGVVFFSER